MDIHDGSSKGKTKNKTERKTTQIQILTLDIGDITAMLQSLQRSISHASQDVLVTLYNQRFLLTDITQTDKLTDQVT